jgi:hypothetical protein
VKGLCEGLIERLDPMGVNFKSLAVFTDRLFLDTPVGMFIIFRLQAGH